MPMKMRELVRLKLRLQDRLALLAGCAPEGRAGIVAAMLHRDAAEATGYWLQLVVAAGIATLGLVVGSTAVVIGAMLIAPLMGPIVHLGMGLATGSPVLVLRAVVRVAASVAVVVACGALITLAVPFHELNAEIAARTTPTVLDLATAAFCALAGVYATMRSGSDVATTAAGTSIGISLVPPLCASGYGVGTTTAEVATGAALLFLTNLAAIVAVGTIAFVAAGFDRVPVRELEAKALESDEDGSLAQLVVRRLAKLFAARAGPWLRLLMPLALLAAVYVPLRSALDEVAWQVRVRKGVQEAMAELPVRLVQTRVRVERNEVELGVVLLGTTEEAEAIHGRLDARLRELAGIAPRLEVTAVPDAAAFAGLEHSLKTVPAAAPPPPPPPPRPEEQLAAARALVREAVARRWPERSAGAPLAVALGALGEPLAIEVAHVGPPLDGAAREALERALSADLQGSVALRSRPFDAASPGPDEAPLAFVARVAPAIAASRQVDGLFVCLTTPPAPARKKDPDAPLRAALEGLVAGHPRVSRVEGPFSLAFAAGGCPAPVTAAAP